MMTRYRMGSIFWLIVGIYVAISAYQLDLGEFSEPGPGLIFFGAAVILIIFSIIDLSGIFTGQSPKDHQESIWAGTQWKRLLLVLGALLAYSFLFDILGFILCTFLLMVFLFRAVEPTKWWVAILSSLSTLLISYGVFNLWLKVPFPSGILGF